MLRVLIVADVQFYVEALAEFIQREEGVQVVGTCAPIEGTMTMVRQSSPDVVLLDMSRPDTLAMIATLRESSPPVRVVALGLAEIPGEVIAAAEAGVSSYVTRGGSLTDLVQAIRDAVRGELTCSPQIAASLLSRVGALAAHRSLPDEGFRLTRRELEIAHLIDDGLSNKEIATRLCIEISTVKNHVHNVLEKLNARRRGEAAARLRPAFTRLNSTPSGRLDLVDLDPQKPSAPASRVGD